MTSTSSASVASTSTSRPSSASTRAQPVVNMLSLVNSLPDIRPRVSRNEKFHKAIQDDDTNEVTSLLAFSSHSTSLFEKIDVNECDSYGMTALHYSCVHGNVDIVDELLHHGALPSINKRDHDGATPLHYACQHAHLNIVKKLLQVSDQAKLQADSSTANTTIITSTSTTIDNTSDKKKGTGRINVNAATKSGLTPLIKLAASRPATIAHVPIIAELLYQHHAKINHASVAGITALHAAVLGSNMALVDWLLQHGAHVNALTADGKSPLDYALLDARPKREMATFLISFNGSANQAEAKALIDSTTIAKAQALTHARQASLDLATAHQQRKQYEIKQQLSHRAEREEKTNTEITKELEQSVASTNSTASKVEEFKENKTSEVALAKQDTENDYMCEEEEDDDDSERAQPQEETEEEKAARVEFRRKIFERWQQENPDTSASD